jgi:hypothetical protein
MWAVRLIMPGSYHEISVLYTGFSWCSSGIRGV